MVLALNDLGIKNSSLLVKKYCGSLRLNATCQLYVSRPIYALDEIVYYMKRLGTNMLKITQLLSLLTIRKLKTVALFIITGRTRGMPHKSCLLPGFHLICKLVFVFVVEHNI